MATTTVHASAAARNAAFSGTSTNTLLGATAVLRIYDGVVPANADTALSGNNLLATLTLAATPVASVATGTATLGAIGSAAAALTGTASFWRIYDSAGSPACQFQGEVTATGGGGSMLLATVSIVAAATISCSAATISLIA